MVYFISKNFIVDIICIIMFFQIILQKHYDDYNVSSQFFWLVLVHNINLLSQLNQMGEKGEKEKENYGNMYNIAIGNNTIWYCSGR